MNNHNTNTSTATTKAGSASSKTMSGTQEKQSPLDAARKRYFNTETDTEERYPGVSATVYRRHMINNKVFAQGFSGKRQRPVWVTHFANDEVCDAYVGQWVKSLEQELQNTNTLKVGDVLYSCWGYEQTNVYFYQVTEVSSSGAMVTVRELETERHEAETMQYDIIPLLGKFKSGPLRRRVQDNGVRIDDVARAYYYEMREISPGVKVGVRMLRGSSYA